VREHVLRFLRLASQVREDRIDATWLGHLEHRDGLFPEIDYRVYRRMGRGGGT
jgi:1,4-alpha-glucan branching enzyme